MLRRPDVHQVTRRSRTRCKAIEHFAPATESLEPRLLLASYTVNDASDLGDSNLDDGVAKTKNGTVTLAAIYMQGNFDRDFNVNITITSGLNIPTFDADFSQFTVQLSGTDVTLGMSSGFGPGSSITGITFNDFLGIGVGTGANCTVKDCKFLGETFLSVGANSQVLHCTAEGGLAVGDGGVVTSSIVGKSGTGSLKLGNVCAVSDTTVNGSVVMGSGNSFEGCSVLAGTTSMFNNNTVKGNFLKGGVSIAGSGNEFDNNIVQDGGLHLFGQFDDPAKDNTVSNNTFRNGSGLEISFLQDSTIKNNTIFNSDTWGINISSDGPSGGHTEGRNKIIGNKIGIDTGGAFVGNNLGIKINGSGKDTIGGTNAGEGNTIVGIKHGAAISISSGKQNVIQGNFVGTNSSGAANMGNAETGISIRGDGENTIGGATAGAGNIVASNGSTTGTMGIDISASKNLIQGNRVGRAKESDPASFGHRATGMSINGDDNTIGGTTAPAANIVGGQQKGPFTFSGPGGGILVFGDRNLIQGNRIGTDAAGTANLGNTGTGLSVAGKSNTIGGSTEAAGNIIAFNGFGDADTPGRPGISIGGANSTKNVISHNSIFGNKGRGIQLGSAQLHINDVGLTRTNGSEVTLVKEPDQDTGANDLQNFPFLDDVVITGGNVLVTGKLWSTPNSDFRIEIYSNDNYHKSGFGDGQTFLGSFDLHTNKFGYASIFESFPQKGGRYIAATATSIIDGKPANTSEFSMVDTDADGLADAWETNGIDFDGDSKTDYELTGADPDKKDIFVEVDAMSGLGPIALPAGIPAPVLPANVKRTGTSIDLVTAAFAQAPNINRGLTTGINLHIDLDETLLTPENWIGAPAADHFPVQFNQFKLDHFGTPGQRADANKANILAAKALAYRYVVFARNHGDGSSSGVSELAGNDSAITMPRGFFNLPPNPVDADLVFARDQAGTFMHEFGHQLGLHHGGGGSDQYGRPLVDDILYKPNLASVMNYTWQIPSGLHRAGLVYSGANVPDYAADWELDYSRRSFATINENALDEASTRIGGRAGHHVPVILQDSSGNPHAVLIPEDAAVDWDLSGVPGDAAGAVVADLNNFRGPSPGETLKGAEDWSGIDFSFLDRGQAVGDNDGEHNDVEVNELPSSATSGGAQADVAITQSASVKSPALGETFSFTLSVKNNGPASANEVVVTDAPPAGYHFQSAQTSLGRLAFDQGALIATIGDLSTSDVVTLTIQVRADQTGTWVHSPVVSALTVDPVASNNTSRLELTVGPQAISALSGKVSTQNVGGRNENVISVAFDGPLQATSVSRLSLYRLSSAGKDGKFGTKDDAIVSLRSASYDPRKKTIVIRTKSPLNRSKELQLRIRSEGLLDRFGRPIDGDSDHSLGGDLIAKITKKGVSIQRSNR